MTSDFSAWSCCMWSEALICNWMTKSPQIIFISWVIEERLCSVKNSLWCFCVILHLPKGICYHYIALWHIFISTELQIWDAHLDYVLVFTHEMEDWKENSYCICANSIKSLCHWSLHFIIVSFKLWWLNKIWPFFVLFVDVHTRGRDYFIVILQVEINLMN